jgi:hypothetical protein
MRSGPRCGSCGKPSTEDGAARCRQRRWPGQGRKAWVRAAAAAASPRVPPEQGLPWPALLSLRWPRGLADAGACLHERLLSSRRMKRRRPPGEPRGKRKPAPRAHTHQCTALKGSSRRSGFSAGSRPPIWKRPQQATAPAPHPRPHAQRTSRKPCDPPGHAPAAAADPKHRAPPDAPIFPQHGGPRPTLAFQV